MVEVSRQAARGLEPTYEGLKQQLARALGVSYATGLEPTYEGLKLGYRGFYVTNGRIMVWSLPMRD